MDPAGESALCGQSLDLPAYAMKPSQKLAWAKYQICQAALGFSESITCPYCDSDVVLGAEKLCCDPMGVATSIVLDQMELEGLRNSAMIAASADLPFPSLSKPS
jgi:hypothetical protein